MTSETILIVDDQLPNLKVLATMLKGKNYKVRKTMDGESAIEAVQIEPPDLILLDINMPDMNGYEVCQRLKSDEKTKDVPIIFISALSEVFDKVKAFEVGGIDYITKPFQEEEVLARINSQLTIKKQQKLLQKDKELLIEKQKTLEEVNIRISAELNVARQMQELILPNPEELEAIKDLDIAGFMEPADEVGGDYYDVLYNDGIVTIGIGDVTGHGLESGILMVMTQTAVRTLKELREMDTVTFLATLNRAIYKNVQRMDSDKNLTLAILNYSERKMSLSGQHEEAIVVRSSGEIECIDTIDLGLPIGLDDEISDFVDQMVIELQPGDGIVLYTDGITEARDMDKSHYGLERLCDVIHGNWQLSSKEIQEAVIKDVRRHIGKQRVFDDITLLVIKQL